MPTQASKTRELPRPDPVRPGETWKQYIDRLRAANTLGASQMAGIVSATVLMGKDPNAPANGRMLEALSQRVARQSSFRALTRDPEALRLARGGKGAEMIVRMGEHKKRRDEMLRKYKRDPSQAKADAVFFKNVKKSIHDSMANHSAAQRERESKRYLEMLKQLDHAQSLAEQGIAMDGKTARTLAHAVKSYNDGGGKTPGGKVPAAAAKEALCVLKRVMPAEEFNDYCSSINEAHNAKTPAHRRYVDPGKYGEELINGGARTARELMQNAQRRMSRGGMTVDGCAAVTAIMKLSSGNPNAIISRAALETEVGKLKQPGSAFLRAMDDPASRAKYAELAANGKVATLGKTITHDAKAHSVRSAQWQIQQAKGSASKGGGVSEEKLAMILAARELATNADPSQMITNTAFRSKAEQIRSSPNFAELSNQYRTDRSFHNRINSGLQSGDGGKALQEEYLKMNTPQKQKEAPVLQAPPKD